LKSHDQKRKYSTVAGIPITELMPEERINALVEEPQTVALKL
jgi:hypothetical protein